MKRILMVVIGFLMSNNAYAYLDPGSASLWVQGVLAAVAGAGATVRIWWRFIKSKVKGKNPF